MLSTLLIGVALSTTAIGTLMPILRDAGELDTPLGPFTLAAGVAGEFGPILAISLLLSEAAGPGVNAMLLIAFAVVTRRSRRARSAGPSRPGRHATIERTMDSSAPFAVRLAILILMGLLYLTSRFGLDVVLGAFAAGIVVGLVTKNEAAEPVRGQARGHRLRLPDPDLLRRQRHHLRPAGAFPSVTSVMRLPVFLACSWSCAARPCGSCTGAIAVHDRCHSR